MRDPITEEEFLKELDALLERCIHSEKIDNFRYCQLLWVTLLSHYRAMHDDRFDIDRFVESLGRDARAKYKRVDESIVKGVNSDI